MLGNKVMFMRQQVDTMSVFEDKLNIPDIESLVAHINHASSNAKAMGLIWGCAKLHIFKMPERIN